MMTYRIYDEGYEFEDDCEFFDTVNEATAKILERADRDGLHDFFYAVESEDGDIEAIVYRGMVFTTKEEADNIDLSWSDYTKEEHPETSAIVGKFRAVIKHVTPHPDNRFANRFWEVVYNGKVTVGSGYTYGTASSEKCCIVVLREWDAKDSIRLNEFINPRQG